MSKKIIRDLGDGLILRHATAEDTNALVQFNREIHGENEWDTRGLDDWTRDLLSGDSPYMTPDDFTVVEDTKTGEIVSSCCLISQTWSYEGIPFKVGRPELVGTKKDYRRRGLVRTQFDIMHEWSLARGELAQAITGIPFYYRQFGYAMALNLSGGHFGYEVQIPELKKDEKEPYTLRPAKKKDIPFLMERYERGCARSPISAIWDEALWEYELKGKRQYNINRREIYIIEDTAGEPVGFIGIPPIKWGHTSSLTLFEITEDSSWSEVTPSVLRFLWQKGLEKAKEQEAKQKIVGFWLGEAHPAYTVTADQLARISKPYAYYMRVPDLTAFITKIQPALEERLAHSAFANYSGELKISFYKDGLLIKLDKGKITEIKNLAFAELEKPQAEFPPFTFLHLVFGHRTVRELRAIHIDCMVKNEVTANLIDALFPKQVSEVWPIS
jgi:hypothetical protein